MSWHVQLFCSLGWSWLGHWRWQGYHVQAQIQSPKITNKSTKNEGPSENMSFNGETVWKFQTKKKEQEYYSPSFKKPAEHEAPESVNWTKRS